MRRAVPICIAVLATVAVGCGGGDDDQQAGGGGSTSGETLTVWNNEFQPDRMKATQAILDEFTQKSGIRTKLVAVPEDQLATLMTNAAAAGELPDVVLGTPLDRRSSTRRRRSSTPRRRRRSSIASDPTPSPRRRWSS